MKKLIFLAIIGVFTVACGLSNSNSTDTTSVDTFVVDTTQVDSSIVDTAVDTAK